jgi:hypothetical protein
MPTLTAPKSLQLKARDWQSVVRSDSFSDPMRLVHLAMRLEEMDADRIRGELVKARRRAYEDEITIQARRIGCSARRGNLRAGPSLTELNEMSRADGESVVNTYNVDLAAAIANIRSEVPTANRHVYAKRLADWEGKRNKWKSAQIAEFTEGTARAMAQRDFVRFNDVQGVAVLKPETAAEPICQGWINRGEVPIAEAVANPPPYHQNCPHYFNVIPNKVSPGECAELWVGEG